MPFCTRRIHFQGLSYNASARSMVASRASGVMSSNTNPVPCPLRFPARSRPVRRCGAPPGRAVAQTVKLVESAGFETGGHQKNVGTGLDQVESLFVYPIRALTFFG